MSRKILVVDDNPDIIELLKNRLEFNHFKVITAINGTDAIVKAKQHQPELILMDITMPNLDGGETVRGLRALASMKRVPVIFVTATVSDLDKDMIENGIIVDDERFDIIAKPIDSRKLLGKINELFGVS